MKQTIISVIVGSVVGGIVFFPPYIPIQFSLLDLPLHSHSLLADLVLLLLLSMGIIIGGLVGWFITKFKIPLAPFDNKAMTIFAWCVWIFWILGIELGFLFSPAVTLIGSGSTSLAMNLFIIPFIFTGSAGIILGVVIGIIIIVMSYSVKKVIDLLNQFIVKDENQNCQS